MMSNSVSGYLKVFKDFKQCLRMSKESKGQCLKDVYRCQSMSKRVEDIYKEDDDECITVCKDVKHCQRISKRY